MESTNSRMTRLTYKRLSAELKTSDKKLDKLKNEMHLALHPESFEYDFENYDAAQRAYEKEMLKTAEIKLKIHDARIIKPRSNIDVVDIGNVVHVEFLSDGKVDHYTLLGDDDHDTRHNWISCFSPLGKAIRGAKLNDQCSFQNGDQNILVKIKKILPGDFFDI